MDKLRGITLILILMFVGCKGSTDKKNSNGGDKNVMPANFEIPYDFSEPGIIKLPVELNEISGIAYDSASDMLYAVEDEDGILYSMSMKKPELPTRIAKFSKKADFEDIVILGEDLYVLFSNGDVIKVKINNPGEIVQKYKFTDADRNEFETLVYDASLNKLLLICKDCKGDKKKYASVWQLDISTGEYKSSDVRVKAADLDGYPLDVALKPSAAVIDPISGDMYVLSSVNKMLIITDSSGNPK
ncbi:MAG: SdiA-regulated domain-containing protein, partial [Chitinophagaceae bacterium]